MTPPHFRLHRLKWGGVFFVLHTDLTAHNPTHFHTMFLRWQELQEIHALEQLAGSLTMKCQTEQVATAGYWYHWLDTCFGILAGRLPLAIVDMDNITTSPKLPTILRNPDTFRPLPTLVRQRHQTEFKRRFGLTGDVTGLDVHLDWRPTMTPAYGLPILLDPRLNNVSTKVGLTVEKHAEYLEQIHTLHYKWYLHARLRKIAQQRRKRAAAVEFLKLAQVTAAEELRRNDPASPITEDDMGWDNAVAPSPLPKPLPLEAPTEVVLIGEADFLSVSKHQYAAYVTACRTDVRWRVLYPDPEYCVGQRGVFWQEKLANVSLAPVWDVLETANKDGRFGFFCALAKHSRANVYKLQASSFVERVNSAGKIVLNETNIKLEENKVEMRVMLRMNRKWMAHMKSTYPDMNENIMGLLRASHDALELPPPEESELPPLALTLEDDPHWPPNEHLDADLARAVDAFQ